MNEKLSTAHAPTKVPKGQGTRGFIVALTGTSLEWYDFAIYSAASALVFGQVFSHPLTRWPGLWLHLQRTR